MTPQSYEVTHSDSALVTAHQAQIRRVIAEEHGAVQIRPAQAKHLDDRQTMRYESSIGSESSRL